MGSVTAAVRRALETLGYDTPDQEIKTFIAKHDATMPGSQISLALRKIRGRVIPVRAKSLDNRNK